MRSSFTTATGLKLVRTPSYRHQTMRRRLMMVGLVVALLIAGAMIFQRSPAGGLALPPVLQESVR